MSLIRTLLLRVLEWHASVQPQRDRGQSTAEYALVMLGAATVGLVFLTWAGDTGLIEELFDKVLQSVIGGL